jgi:integrase
LGDLRRDALDSWLAKQHNRPDGKTMSARTRNAYQGAMVSFSNWCVDTKRLASNPFKAMPKASENAGRVRQRRAMTEAELVRLLAVARNRPLQEARTVRRGRRRGEACAKLRAKTVAALDWIGRERALIYKTLVLTGLRKSELASLTVAQLDLDGAIPCLSLHAADEKNREGNDLILRGDLAADLRAWLAAKLDKLRADALVKGTPIPARLPPTTPLFDVPSGLLRILDRDLRAAGIAKRDDRGRTLDVHALRTTFGTLLSKGGVAPRTAQAAMRHSDLKLTMQVYTDPRLLDVAGALNALPALPIGGIKVAKATGTDGRSAPSICTPVCTNSVQTEPSPDNGSQNCERRPNEGEVLAIDVTSSRVNEKDPPTIAVNGSNESGRLDSNQRPPEPHSGALAKLRHAPRMIAHPPVCYRIDEFLQPLKSARSSPEVGRVGSCRHGSKGTRNRPLGFA